MSSAEQLQASVHDSVVIRQLDGKRPWAAPGWHEGMGGMAVPGYEVVLSPDTVVLRKFFIPEMHPYSSIARN
jgi:hypothetical protein